MPDDKLENLSPNHARNVDANRRQFFTQIRPYVMHHRLKQMPSFVKEKIAIKCFSGSLWPEDSWKTYAYNMGITDNEVIDEIEAKAKVVQLLPLYYAMKYILFEESFVIIIDCMMNMQEDHILSYLEVYTRNLLSKTLTVLLRNAEEDNTTAEQLATEFRKKDAIALTLAQLNKLELQVDFEVPILSEKFMEKIYPAYLRQMESDSSSNIKIFPVIVPEMDRTWIKDKRLKYSFKLWKEVPKFIKVLKDVKLSNEMESQ